MSYLPTSIPINSRAAIAALSLMLWLVALTAFGQAPQSTDVQELPPNRTLEREMTGAQTHRYEFDLQANEFFQARVEQKDFDVTLKLSDANGNVLATMDSPNGKEGTETLSFVAEKTGRYALEVSGFDAKAQKGSYSIRREATRTATAKDRRRVEVERLFVAGATAQNIKGQMETAVKQLTAAQAGWEELADTYMAELTARHIRQLQSSSEISAMMLEWNKELEAANTTLNQGQALSVKSKSDSLSARAKLNEALAMFRALKAKLHDRALAEKIAQSGANSGPALNYVKAFQYFVRSGEATTLSAIGQTFYNLGEWQENADYLKRSILAYQDARKFFIEANISGLDQKQTLFALKFAESTTLASLAGTISRRLGKAEEALIYRSQALEQFRALYQEAPSTHLKLLKLQEALTLQDIGLIHTNTSKNRKTAIEFLSQAMEIYRTFPETKLKGATLLSLIGTQYSLDFNYEAALKNWDAALEIYRELDDKFGQVHILQAKGVMYFLLDNKTKVREAFNQVLEILQSRDYAENYKKKHFSSNDGFEIYSELNDIFIEYIRLDRIAFAYERLEDYEKAIEYYEKALVSARASKEPRDIRTELVSIGFVYTKLEKWDKAFDYYRQALEISRVGNVKEEIANDLAKAGEALLESGKPQEALKYQNEALALFQSVGINGKNAFSPTYSPLLNELGRTHHALGNRRLAILYGKQGINVIQDERQRLRNFDAESQKGFLRKKEKHYRRLAEWLIAEGRIPEAEQVLEMLKQEEVFNYLRRDASETDKLQQRADLRPEERDALKRYDEIADRITTLGAEFTALQELQSKNVELSVEQKNRYTELSTRIEDASRYFQIFLRQLADEFDKRTNTEKDLQENLALQSDLKEWGEGVVFLYTLVGDDRYRVILVTQDTQVDGKYEIKAADLNDKIEKFRQAVQNPAVDPRPTGKELYDILIKPVEKQLDGAKAKTLLWSLDGNLRLLPLAALWNGEQYFGQKYQNVTVTLASRTRLGDTVERNWRALGLGVSEARKVKEPNGTRELSFRSLPAVRTELLSIVQSAQSPNGVMPGQSLIDAEFNESALESQLLRGYKVIHIASHFSLNPGDSTRSFLLLGDGNVLTVDEMKNNPRLSFRGVELLTLSACQTAVVEKDSSGKEIEGFGYVAQQKGAKAILATLWSVADESTQLLMSEFYRLRKANPQLTKAEALQRAQQQMLAGKLKASGPGGVQRGTGEDDAPLTDYSHPYYWSPFVLIGNWR